MCILIADNDEAGRAHVADVENKLAGCASKLINLGVLPNSPEHGDVSDRFAAGNTSADLLALVNDAEQGEPAHHAPIASQSEWPKPLSEAALHGPAGDFVRLVEPCTEADPAALLIQFLVAFGNLCGSSAYRFAGGIAHHLNEYVVIVGDTSSARKGTSWAEVERFFAKVDQGWTKQCVTSGLSTGEGLIYHVRDPQLAQNYRENHGAGRDGANGRTLDAGVDDKRLLVQAGEFAAVMKVAARDGATLSSTLREAWDGKTLRTLAKNSPATATGAHISISAHITREELVRLLDNLDIANGFANRFLWACAKRSKELPWGGGTQDVRLDHLAIQVRLAAEEARNGGEFIFDDEAKRKWEQVYSKLTEGRLGLLGAMLGRRVAHVLRFACIYCALDSSYRIGLKHLSAALALYDYCERSARHIFGNRLGNPDADAIFEALRESSVGLTRTEIRNLFSCNLTGERIDRARDALIKAGLSEWKPIVRKGVRRSAGG